MKKLEELGISPAPWELDDQHDGYISDKIGYAVASADGDCTRNMIANARLIAAAPDMYEALWNECFGENTGTVNCRMCYGVEMGTCNSCPLCNARAALAKASGESEVAK